MRRLTKAQRAKLAAIPDEWEVVPIRGDTRPIGPLIKAGMIEQRSTDVTPDDWGSSPVRLIRQEWRRTDAGRAALQAEKGEG